MGERCWRCEENKDKINIMNRLGKWGNPNPGPLGSNVSKLLIYHMVLKLSFKVANYILFPLE